MRKGVGSVECHIPYSCTVHINPSLTLPLEHSEDAELGEDALTAEEFLPSPPSPSRPPSPAGLSRLAVALSVDSAQVSMLLHVEEETEEVKERTMFP